MEPTTSHKYTKQAFTDLIDCKAHNSEDQQIQTITSFLMKTLNNPEIHLYFLKEVSQKGTLASLPSLRPLSWKLFLNYLSPKSQTWENTLTIKRAAYEKIKTMCMSRLDIQTKSKKKNNSGKKKKDVDHPLSTTDLSEWHNYFEDMDVLEKIDQDIKRTRKEIDFFTQSIANNPKETNHDVLKRILFLYAKERPQVKYVQGLNELLATIYFCLSCNMNPEFNANAEADSYHCFMLLMERIETMYIEKFDDTQAGIEWKLFNVKIELKKVDMDIFTSLNDKNIDFHFFAFKWFTLLFCQEYSMPDALRLWDWILTYEDIFECLKLLSLAALKLKRKTIVYGDFSSIIDSLQNFNIEVETLIKTVDEIRRDLRRAENPGK